MASLIFDQWGISSLGRFSLHTSRSFLNSGHSTMLMDYRELRTCSISQILAYREHITVLLTWSSATMKAMSASKSLFLEYAGHWTPLPLLACWLLVDVVLSSHPFSSQRRLYLLICSLLIWSCNVVLEDCLLYCHIIPVGSVPLAAFSLFRSNVSIYLASYPLNMTHLHILHGLLLSVPSGCRKNAATSLVLQIFLPPDYLLWGDFFPEWGLTMPKGQELTALGVCSTFPGIQIVPWAWMVTPTDAVLMAELTAIPFLSVVGCDSGGGRSPREECSSCCHLLGWASAKWEEVCLWFAFTMEVSKRFWDWCVEYLRNLASEEYLYINSQQGCELQSLFVNDIDSSQLWSTLSEVDLKRSHQKSSWWYSLTWLQIGVGLGVRMMGVRGCVALGWVFAVGVVLGFVCVGMVRGHVGVVGMSWDELG